MGTGRIRNNMIDYTKIIENISVIVIIFPMAGLIYFRFVMWKLDNAFSKYLKENHRDKWDKVTNYGRLDPAGIYSPLEDLARSKEYVDDEKMKEYRDAKRRLMNWFGFCFIMLPVLFLGSAMIVRKFFPPGN